MPEPAASVSPLHPLARVSYHFPARVPAPGSHSPRGAPKRSERVKKAIAEFVQYVKENEPGSLMYLAWQQKDDPTRFIHLFIFQDEAAHVRHGKSEAVKRFEAAYRPELVGGEVVFPDYEMIAGKR